MDVERPSVLVSPFATLESLKTIDQERSPRLMHAHTHPYVFLIFKEVLISLILLYLCDLFLYHCLLNSLSEFLEWIL